MTLDTSRPSVLVVEDEWCVAQDIQLQLEHAGYAVPALAATADEAVRLVCHERPNLVLVDVRLAGGADGIEAAAAIRRCAPEVPLVFLTASSDPGTLARASAVRADGYLVKPFRPPQLLSAVAIGLARGEELRARVEERAHLAETLRRMAESVREPPPDRRQRAAPADDERLRPSALKSLSAREREIAQLLHGGLRLRAAAERLGISYHTARNHLKRIYTKLGVNSQFELLAYLRHA